MIRALAVVLVAALATPSVSFAQPATPKRKPGLWSQQVSSAPQATSKICLDAATDAKLSLWGQQTARATCAQSSFSPMPGGWRFRSQCDIAGVGHVASTGTVTGDLNRAYTVVSDSVTSGAKMSALNGRRQITVKAAYLGPCPAGFKPGDVEVMGMRMNILTMAGGR